MAFYYAVCGGSQGVARLLLDKGANVNAPRITTIKGESGTDMSEDRNSADALQEAAYQGDVAMVNLILDEGADVNAQRGGWGSALQAAVKGGHLHILELLIERGADINSPSNEAGCVLSSAVGHIDCLRFLLGSGADINMRGTGKGDSTALFTAARDKCWEAFHLLLDRGADVNVGGEGGYPLCGLAMCWIKAEYEYTFFDMRRLLDCGADPNVGDAQNGTALYQMCKRLNSTSPPDYVQIVQLLIDHGADVNITGGEDGTPLQVCAHNGCLSVAELLLEHGADVNMQGGEYGNALQAACCSKAIPGATNMNMVRLLLDHGADISSKGGIYGNALQAASFSRNDIEVVRMLLELGADENAEGGKYGTALQAACHHPKIEVVRMLLDSGANINTVGGEYGTALQAACAPAWIRNAEVVRLLLKRGADVNAKGGKFGTALQAACAGDCYNSSQVEILRMLLRHGARIATVQSGKYDSPFQAAATLTAWDDNINALMQLQLDHGANVNDYVLGESGSALHCVLSPDGFLHDAKRLAGRNWSLQLQAQWMSRIRFLLDRGADVNLRGGKYGFPLQAACAVEYGIPFLTMALCDNVFPRPIYQMIAIEMGGDFCYIVTNGVKILLDECPDVDINARGGIFGTALQAAAYSGQMKSVRLLLDHGADITSNEWCGRYRTALNAAVIRGHWDIVDILLEAGAKPDCQLFLKPDEKWLVQVREEHGRSAEKRYRKFWEVEKLRHEQALLRRGRHVAYYYFTTAWLLAQVQLLAGFITAVFDVLI